MTTTSWGVVLGALGGCGVLLVTTGVLALRRSTFETRVVRQVGHLSHTPSLPAEGGSPAQLVFGPLLRSAAAVIERVLGGSISVQRRLQRAGLTTSVAQFRAQQATWGLVGLAGSAGLAALVASRSPERLAPMVVLAVVAGLSAVLLRDNRLTSQVRNHEGRVLAELPAVAELLALSVAAGEGVAGALERVVSRSHGAFSSELARVLAEIRTGAPVAVAFDDYSHRTGLPVVARFAGGIAVAVERGTPLADVLHAQAGDVREAQRRSLIESGARREVAMMIPVVFLVLPTTVMFAFWPGVVGLRLVTP